MLMKITKLKLMLIKMTILVKVSELFEKQHTFISKNVVGENNECRTAIARLKRNVGIEY